MFKTAVALIIFSSFSASIYSQSEDSGQSVPSGIHFINGKNWEEIKSIAKQQGKYIFVDCYATWCGPCKLMDKEVYPNPIVGDFMNKNFVCIKIQTDSTNVDNELIKNWYYDASILCRLYQVKNLPSYLFFNPNGQIVHRAVGAIRDTTFLKLARNALNPEKQYYTLLSRYQNGNKDYKELLRLAVISKEINEDSLAGTIARDYIENYLDKLGENELLNPDYINFVTHDFPSQLKSKDKIFHLLYSRGPEVSDLMNDKPLPQFIVIYIITKEEVDPVLYPDSKAINHDPDWKTLQKAISDKYDTGYSAQVILSAQFQWYYKKKNWPLAIKYYLNGLERNGFDNSDLGSVFTNNMIYELVFKHSSDKVMLRKAAGIMRQIIQVHPNDFESIDTYANLLYKSGQNQRAIFWERKAANGAPKDLDIALALKKMKKGYPTWK